MVRAAQSRVRHSKGSEPLPPPSRDVQPVTTQPQSRPSRGVQPVTTQPLSRPSKDIQPEPTRALPLPSRDVQPVTMQPLSRPSRDVPPEPTRALPLPSRNVQPEPTRTLPLPARDVPPTTQTQSTARNVVNPTIWSRHPAAADLMKRFKSDWDEKILAFSEPHVIALENLESQLQEVQAALVQKEIESRAKDKEHERSIESLSQKIEDLERALESERLRDRGGETNLYKQLYEQLRLQRNTAHKDSAMCRLENEKLQRTIREWESGLRERTEETKSPGHY